MLSDQQLTVERALDFSELYKQSSSLCVFSPDNRYLATAVESRVVVRDASTLEIAYLFTCLDLVQAIDWSADSKLLLCASFALGAVSVWNLDDTEWSAKIDEGVAGLAAVRFAPDGRHVLCFSEFQLRLTIWSLITREAVYIQYPKFADKGIQWRYDHRYLAVAERRDCKDSITVYDGVDWTILKNFSVGTTDLEDIAWSPHGRFIAAWDSLIDYRILIYTPDGRCLKNFSAYDIGLGIKSVQWSPAGHFLAVGSFDQKLRLLNQYTWTSLTELIHPSVVTSPDVTVFKEISEQDETQVDFSKISAGRRHTSCFERVPVPFQIHTNKPDPEKPNPRVGIGLLAFSPDGRYLITRNDNMPNTCWIWEVSKLKLTTIIHQSQPIRSILWNPIYPDRLAISSGNSNITLWTGEDQTCDSVEVPVLNFQINTLKWSPDGRSLLLIDKEAFCVTFFLET